jgi:hypothetical protein
MRRGLRRVAWAILLAVVAVVVWILVSPATEMVAAGRLTELVVEKGTSDAALYRMWKWQLPGTALASCIFSLVVAWAGRAGYPKWGRGGAAGTALGGSIALLLFASPPPGVPFYVWGAAFFITGVPLVAIVEALPDGILRLIPRSFAGLVTVWPLVVTGLLVSIGALTGSLVGERVSAGKGRAAEQRVEADEAG